MHLRVKPRCWLWGFFPLVLVGLLGVFVTQHLIEKDLQRRSLQALSDQGIEWAKPVFQGLDASISGKAPSEAALLKATSVVEEVWGVRKVLNKSSLLPKFSPFLWSASHKDGQVRLKGHVPSYKLKKAITGLVKAKFPKVDLVDKLKVGRGIDDTQRWFGQVSFGLSQLAKLEHGRVSLTDDRFTLEGGAPDETGFRALLDQFKQPLPLQLKRGTIALLPPKVENYIFSARFDEKVLSLEGVVPNATIAQKLETTAGSYFPGAKVQNKLTLGSGAPHAWEKAVHLTLAELSKLETGVGLIQGQDVRLEGVARNNELAKAVRLRVREGYPKGYRVSDVITIKETQSVVTPVPEEKPMPKKEEPEPELVAPAVTSEEELAKRRNWLSPEETETRLKDIHKEQGAVNAKECQLLMNSIVRGSAIRFAVDSDEIQPSSYDVLSKVRSVAVKCTNTVIRIEGHTDSDGASSYNLELSKRRAQAVIAYLQNKGVPVTRMDAKGFGEKKPVASNQTNKGKALNRRIEFVVFEN